MSKKRIYIILCSLLLCLTVFAVLTSFSRSNAYAVEEPDEPFVFEPTVTYVANGVNLSNATDVYNDLRSKNLTYFDIQNTEILVVADGNIYDTIRITFENQDVFYIDFYRTIGVTRVLSGITFLRQQDNGVRLTNFEPVDDVYNYAFTVRFFGGFSTEYDDLYCPFVGQLFRSSFGNYERFNVVYTLATSPITLHNNSFNADEDVTFILRSIVANNIRTSTLECLSTYIIDGVSGSTRPISMTTGNIGSGMDFPEFQARFSPSINLDNNIYDNEQGLYELIEWDNDTYAVGGYPYYACYLPIGTLYIRCDRRPSSFNSRTFVGNSIPLQTIIFNEYQQAYKYGRDTGYNQGYSDAEQEYINITLRDVTPWQIIVDGVNSFLNIKIGYFSFAELLSIGLGLILLVLLMKFLT